MKELIRFSWCSCCGAGLEGDAEHSRADCLRQALRMGDVGTLKRLSDTEEETDGRCAV